MQIASSGYHAPADEQRYHGSVGDDAKISGGRRAEVQESTGAEGTRYGAKAEGPGSTKSCGLQVIVDVVVNGRLIVADRRAVRDAGDAEVDR